LKELDIPVLKLLLELGSASRSPRKVQNKKCFLFPAVKCGIFCHEKQCCGSGSGMDPVPFRPLDPGQGIGKKSRSRSGIRNLFHHGSRMKKFGPGIYIPDQQH
jgi:hypothetical protein